VVPSDLHEFFTAAAGVAGALIGLLFVAISVTAARLTSAEGSAQVHRIRARAALTSFTNALTVSLFALIPVDKIGWTAVSVSVVGLVFIVASLVSLTRVRDKRWSTAREALFLVGLAVVFVLQFSYGFDVAHHPGASGAVEELAILVIVSFLLGIGRSWELIGGPEIAIRRELLGLVRGEELGAGEIKAAPAAAAEGETAGQAD
jgi:hypothetical protein